MVFVPKVWLNSPASSTPLNAAAMIDLESRLAAYTDVGNSSVLFSASLPILPSGTYPAGKTLIRTTDYTQWVSDGSTWHQVSGSGTIAHSPTAGFTPVMTNLVLTVTNTSTDPDPGETALLSYAWNFGDGGTSSATSPSHLYAAAGTYTVTLVATDPGGLSSTYSTPVTATGTAAVERAPFAPGTVWNQSLAQFYAPSGVSTTDPTTNDLYIGISEAMTAGAGRGGVINYPSNNQVFPFWGSNTARNTIAVYIITPAMVAAAHTQLNYTNIYCESNKTTTTYVSTSGGNVTLPFQILGTQKPANGDDAQFTFWDRDNLLGNGGEFWDIWHVTVDGSLNWVAGAGGGPTCQNFSHYNANEATTDGVPAVTGGHAYASRGPGIPYLTGLIRKWELDAGVIKHPIACAWDQPAGTFVYPAAKSDGGSSITFDMPEGGRFFLKSSFPVQDLADPHARTIATAMQQYGLVCADNSGTSKIYLDADEAVGLGANWGGYLAVDLLNDIPLDEFVCVYPGNGQSGYTETVMRIDYTYPTYNLATTALTDNSDPLTGGGSVAVLGSAFIGFSTTPTVTDAVATISTVNSGELLLAFVAAKGNQNGFVSSVIGTGGASPTWKRIAKYQQPRTVVGGDGNISNNGNIWLEVWACRANSSTTGTVTANCRTGGGILQTCLQVIRFTSGATVRRKFANNGNSNAPITPLRGTIANGLAVQFVNHRWTGGTTAIAAEGGATGVSLNIASVSGTTGGSPGGNVVRSSILTRPTGGDISAQPTLSSSAEWLSINLEVT